MGRVSRTRSLKDVPHKPRWELAALRVVHSANPMRNALAFPLVCVCGCVCMTDGRVYESCGTERISAVPPTLEWQYRGCRVAHSSLEVIQHTIFLDCMLLCCSLPQLFAFGLLFCDLRFALICNTGVWVDSSATCFERSHSHFLPLPAPPAKIAPRLRGS